MRVCSHATRRGGKIPRLKLGFRTGVTHAVRSAVNDWELLFSV
jgi:hypothetical protein